MKQKKALGKQTTAKTQEDLCLNGSLSHNEELGELQNLFRTVERSDLQEPSLAQWEKFQDGVMGRIRTLGEEAGGRRIWLQTWKDKIIATDSICLKLLIYLLLAILAAGIILLGYFAYVMLGHQTAEASLGVSESQLSIFQTIRIIVERNEKISEIAIRTLDVMKMPFVM